MPTDLRRITLGGGFQLTWINSGVTPSQIQAHIFTGSEAVVATYAGVSSGNGHYYAEAVVPDSYSPQVFRARWIATINANTQINDTFLDAWPVETGAAGRYISWDDIVGRYADFSDIGGAVQASSHYITYAEAMVDAGLGACFATPFSNNNIIVKDLAIDIAYLRGARSLDQEEQQAILASVNSRFAALKAGEMVMIVDSGDIVRPSGNTAWSSTEDHHPVFGMFDPLNWVVSSQGITDEAADRGWTVS